MCCRVHRGRGAWGSAALVGPAPASREVFHKPDETVMCSEYPEKPAVVKNLVTFDFYSLEGFAATHSTGKRKFHETARVEQTARPAGVCRAMRRVASRRGIRGCRRGGVVPGVPFRGRERASQRHAVS